jgi:hypothetical protein
LSFRNTAIVATSLAILLACARPDWPPQVAELREQFLAGKAVFLEIEQEMVRDGLMTMSPSKVSGGVRHPDFPALTPIQEEKYRNILDRAHIYINVDRSDEQTQFDLVSQEHRGRLYLFTFVHNFGAPLPYDCSESDRNDDCGYCSVDLDDDWFLTFTWVPDSGQTEIGQCISSQR